MIVAKEEVEYLEKEDLEHRTLELEVLQQAEIRNRRWPRGKDSETGNWGIQT